jgi:LysR family transcriptional activator of nhaA
MEWLNYHHLYYFSVIARAGGVAAAARELRLTHSTLSAQLRMLEAHFGAPLFERRGKRLILTPFGIEAASYAADIFRLGRELGDVARGRAHPGREGLRVGVVATLPKTLVVRLLEPGLDVQPDGLVQVRQAPVATLIEELAAGRLHLVLADEIPTTTAGTKIHAHPLGETEILLYASRRIARVHRKDFPASLRSARLLLPAPASPLRRRLDAWFAEHDIVPSLAAEIDDAGVLRAFGGAGRGVFPVRAALRAEVESLADVDLVGPCEGVRERYFVLSAERRIRHPAVVALVEQARAELHAIGSERRR